MALDAAIKNMSAQIIDILEYNFPSIYIYGSYVLGDFRLGWSDIDILVLTEKQISEEQAEKLVCLRQYMNTIEPDNQFYGCFEGGMLTQSAFISHAADRVIYWGTSGQRITDKYFFDACCMCELLESALLIYGRDVRTEFAKPTYAALKNNMQNHYETIRKYARETNRSIYSFGWLLDISRCIYTLRTAKIVSKTFAGEWAIKNGIFNNIDNTAALEIALIVRKNPLKYKDDSDVLDYSENLGDTIQQYADVFEEELKKANLQ